MEKKNKGGRPTKYKPEFAEEIIKYFDREIYHTEEIIKTYKNGETSKEIIKVANDVPFFSDFATYINVSIRTLEKWAIDENKPEFVRAYKTAKKLQEKILVLNGLQGRYQPSFAIFTAKNILGWRDKTEFTGNGLTITIAKDDKEL